MSGVDWTGWTEDLRRRVETRLRAYLESELAKARACSPESVELVDAVTDLTLRGGKRLRPIVLACAHHAVAPAADLEPTVVPGAAMELLQTYFLIQDDWMDLDDERRGGPSVYAALRRRHGDDHLGASLAVLAGDLAAAYACDVLAEADVPHGRLREVLAVFLEMQREVLFGQQLDLVTSPEVERMYDLKTGSYTVRGPLRIGALVADAGPAQLDALDRFAGPLGVAFQVRDELLGTFGDPAATGKPTGNDLRAGKHTLLVAEARRAVPEAERGALERVHGDATATDAEIADAIALLDACGARASVEARLRALVEQAGAALEGAPLETSRLRTLVAKLAVRDH